ncbi:MAG: hypothetical protein GXX96_28775 [Planctomycetaceae bacterium]|nr:hypothetical protein [Planctomycetaceae bacterium]
MRYVVFVVLPIIMVSTERVWGAAPNDSATPAKTAYVQIVPPESVPDRLPAGFDSFIEVANEIYGHVVADEVMSIEQTLRKHTLWPQGRVMDVRLCFHSGGGVQYVTVTVPVEQEKRILRISVGRTGIHGLMQSDMFWDGMCEVVVNHGRITAFREYEVDADERAAYYVGLQAEWSLDGALIREEYLEERRPIRLPIGAKPAD